MAIAAGGGVMTFISAQPIYAAHKIPTFPVCINGKDKYPAVKGYNKVGLRGSSQLVFRFRDAAALGFMCGPRTRISVADVDTTNESVLAEFLHEHGPTPIIARTARRKFHAWYRHNGEGRYIRPWDKRPFDILGGGFVVVPPSKAPDGGKYEFIEGGLDDLDRLPVMHNLDAYRYTRQVEARLGLVRQGERNTKLWRHCMRAAHHCDSFDGLLDVARTFNDNCEPPMEDREVISTAASAWGYTERGQNRFGQHGAYFPFDEIAAMMADQDAFILLAYLRAENGPAATVWCTNTLAEKFGWGRQRLAGARNRLIELGYLKLILPACQGHPAKYRWAR
jgi:Bifunctional DNA primase/polymerase, N-terminal/Primase C terminal 1 (PriCT-1)